MRGKITMVSYLFILRLKEISFILSYNLRVYVYLMKVLKQAEYTIQTRTEATSTLKRKISFYSKSKNLVKN